VTTLCRKGCRGVAGFLLGIAEAEIVVHEADDPNAVVELLDAEALTGEHAMAIMSCRSGLELLGDIAARNALEGLDDDHAAAAAGTEMRQCLRRPVAEAEFEAISEHRRGITHRGRTPEPSELLEV
jgi:hypothetical protein